MQTSKFLKEQQDFINEANQQMPILLTSKSRLIILEAILVTRARNGQPIDDLLTAAVHAFNMQDILAQEQGSKSVMQGDSTPKGQSVWSKFFPGLGRS